MADHEDAFEKSLDAIEQIWARRKLTGEVDIAAEIRALATEARARGDLAAANLYDGIARREAHIAARKKSAP